MSDEEGVGYFSNMESDGLSETESEDSLDLETPAEKRLRLAKSYLESVKTDLGNELEVDAAELDRELIASRLRNEELEARGKAFTRVASEYSQAHLQVHRLGKHELPITASVFSPNGKFLFSASKDGTVFQWDVIKKTKVWKIEKAPKPSNKASSHTGQVLSLAVSWDNRFLALGGQDKLIHIWDIKGQKHLKAFKHHKAAISALVFQRGQNRLISASLDRTLAVWDIENLCYVESLYGHQDSISSVDALYRERAVSIGQRDRSARFWKIPEESQLVFNHPEASGGCFDTVSLVDEENFLTGSDNGTISLWNINKKKPVYSLPQGDSGSPIISLATLHFTDLFVSGSNTGEITFWKLNEDRKGFAKLFAQQMPGFLNSMAFSDDGSHLAVSSSREPKLGRWAVDKTVKNFIFLISLRK